MKKKYSRPDIQVIDLDVSDCLLIGSDNSSRIPVDSPNASPYDAASSRGSSWRDYEQI